MKRVFENLWWDLVKSKKVFKIGLFGPPNSGKTTLANTIGKQILAEEDSFGETSSVAHETRTVVEKEKLSIQHDGRKIVFNLADTPGIATRVDYEVFTKAGMSERQAKQRAKEATRGVIESVKMLDSMDIVILVIDSTKNPYNQVNLTLLGNLEARNIPVIIAANKVDLKSSKLKKVQDAFPKYTVIGVSAKFSQHIDELYAGILEKARTC